MRFAKFITCTFAFVLAASGSPASALPHIHRGPTSPRQLRTRAAHGRSQPKATAHIEPERATEIQTALITSRYLSGPPSGSWDAQTQAAMVKFQADHGWQTKLVPDARAIIMLGLGSSNASSADLAANSAQTRDAVAPPVETQAVPSPSNQ